MGSWKGRVAQPLIFRCCPTHGGKTSHTITQNNVNDISSLEFYHYIRGNLTGLTTSRFLLYVPWERVSPCHTSALC